MQLIPRTTTRAIQLINALVKRIERVKNNDSLTEHERKLCVSQLETNVFIAKQELRYLSFNGK